jgi:hypothetical protein
LGIRKRTTEEYKQKVFEKHGDKVEILSEYLGDVQPIDFVYHCEKHGDTYKTLNAKNVIAKCFQPCKQCDSELKSLSGRNRINTKEGQLERFKNYCESMGGKLISTEWTTAKDIYEIDCGNQEHPHFFSSADSVMNKPQWCPYCCGRKGNFNERYKKIIEEHDGEMLSDYINGTMHITVKCNKDGYIWDIYPNNLMKGRWCPVCNMPYSERVPYDYLGNNHYNIRIQYGFDDLYGENKELYKFDFAVFNKYNKLLGLIEIDDNEHRYNHTQPKRVKARERDKIKDQYCINNKINIIRVPYDEYNKELKNYDSYYNYIDNQLKDFLNRITQLTA